MKTLARTALMVAAAVAAMSLTNCAGPSEPPASIGFYHGQATPPIPASNADGGWTESHPARQL